MLTLPNPARTRRRRLGGAFTLIELIVVVIIIAVLAAIAGVAYNQFVDNARDTAVLADAKQIDTALTARSAHDDQTPVAIVAANADMLAYLQVTAGEHLTATAYPTAGVPTAVQVTDGTRYACLALGTEVGQASTITLGPCGGGGGTPEPDPTPTPEPTPEPGPVVWSSAAAGDSHTCSIRTDGTAWCWGDDTYGQLGNGAATTTAQAGPVKVSGEGAWTSLDAGFYHTCGIKTDETAWCWGYDGSGQLGNGAPSGNQISPVQVAGTWSSLTAGTSHTCGIKTDETAWCWGYDGYDQLGNGAAITGNQVSPTQVVGTGTWTSLTAGGQHTCGIKTDGTAWCWGYDGNGQIGNGTTTANQASPVQVVGTGTWTSLIAGTSHTCGTKTGGSAWCWGSDSSGQLGNGTASGNQVSPVQVSGTGTWTSLTADSGTHTCGTTSDGTAWCWGNDSSGQLGNGAASGPQVSPTQVVGTGTWTSLTAGSIHTCGIKIDGSAWCWGNDSSDKLGNGPTAGAQASPVQVVEPAA